MYKSEPTVENGGEVVFYAPHINVSSVDGHLTEEVGYHFRNCVLDPKTVNPGEWHAREKDGWLLAPGAGEMLYGVRYLTGSQ